MFESSEAAIEHRQNHSGGLEPNSNAILPKSVAKRSLVGDVGDTLAQIAEKSQRAECAAAIRGTWVPPVLDGTASGTVIAALGGANYKVKLDDVSKAATVLVLDCAGSTERLQQAAASQGLGACLDFLCLLSQ